MRELEDPALSSRTLANSARPISQNEKQEDFSADFRRKSLAMFMEETKTLEQYYTEEDPSESCNGEALTRNWKLCDSSGSDSVLTYRGASKVDKVTSDLSATGDSAGTGKHILENGNWEKSSIIEHGNGKCEHEEAAGGASEAEAAVVAAHDEFGLGDMFHCCAGQRRLLHVDQMPDHLQFNKFVRTGYRDVQDAWDCFMSLFYLHNETVNIFTHVAPIFVVIYYWRSMFPWDDIQGHTYFNFLGWSHVIGSISPWLGSVVYHLFMNHSRGPQFYKFLLQMDMFGIWVAQCFGAMTNLTASTWCLSDGVQMMWMGIYAIASIWGLHKALTARSALGRRMCFAMVFISRLFGFALRISKYGGGNPGVLTHVILQDVVSVVGGFIGVVRIPELWFPGKLDLFFNSHHIMHVMVVLAVFHMNLATNGDIRWILDNYSKEQCVTLL